MTLSNDFKRPVNVVFLLLALVGILLSIFFYFTGRKTKAISFQINEPSSLIFDSHNASSAISVIEHDSVPIKDNVYLLTGVIWNSGNESISIDDIRQNISLNLFSAKKILDFKITKQTDPTIAKFNLVKTTDSSIALFWKYFDPGYGFKFQIIYTGDNSAEFNLKGKILDIKEFEKVNTQDNELKKIRIVSLCFILVIFFISLFVKIKDKKPWNTPATIINIGLPLIVMIYLALQLYFNSMTDVPFSQ